jgi:polyferredoxin/tetratricopeptide (TPR) repeat protein
VLGTLTLLMIAHVIQWLVMGRTVSPIEPSESMFTLQNGAVNAGFIFFSLAIVATLIFGRFVCGWGCHIVALQDFCAWLLKKMGLKPRPFRSRLLIYVPLIVALYMFVWPTAVRFFAKPPNEPLIPQFTNHLITSEFWATFPPVAVAIPFLFICGFMTVYFLGAKGFCTYACPYGGFFGVADKLAPGRIRVTDACNECGHCTAVCTSNVIVHREVKEFGMVVDPGCMKCMDCVSVCPNDALYFGFGRPSIGISTKKVAKNFSLTWPEELGAAVVFFLSFLAVWDVYQLVPMLMALGIACVTTFLTVRVWQMLRAHDLAFYKWALRAGGRVQTAGWAFLAFAFLWVGTNVHSGLVRYHERAGAIAFQNVQVPDELALASSEPGQWLTPAERASIIGGRDHFRKASRIGLFTNVEALPKAAWLEYLSGETDAALERLAEAAARQNGQAKGVSLYYRGALLNRLGRPDEAMRDLQEAAADAPDLVTVREEKGEALWRSDRREEAVAAWKDALRLQPKLPVAASLLAGATVDATSATEYQQTADRLTPDDPYFHWMLGQRLLNLGMSEAAERHFRRAIELDPKFRSRRR